MRDPAVDLPSDLDSARVVHARFVSEIAKRKRLISEHQRWVRGAESIVAGYREMYPALAEESGEPRDSDEQLPDEARAVPDTVGSDTEEEEPDGRPASNGTLVNVDSGRDVDGPSVKPRGRTAVLAVMRDQPEQWMTIKEVTAEMVRRGWHPDSDDPESTVRATLFRLYKDNRVRKDRVDGRTVTYQLIDA